MTVRANLTTICIVSLVLLVPLSFCSEPRRSIADQVESLVAQLDSVYNKDLTGGLDLADSIIGLDPNNYKALETAGFILFNQYKWNEALPYFTKAIALNDEKPWLYIVTGICTEKIIGLDSAKFYYQLGYEAIDSSYVGFIGTPQLLTILNGKEDGMNDLSSQDSEIFTPLFYEQLRNDIELYNNGGMLEFFPLFDTSYYSSEYYVTIPDELYDSGEINGMDKIELTFARRGINVTASGTDHKNKSFKFRTTEKYEPRLEKFDTFKIKRL